MVEIAAGCGRQGYFRKELAGLSWALTPETGESLTLTVVVATG